jgi:hypothetical protein
MLAPESRDAGFFRMMHKVQPVELPEAEDADRRQRARRSYPTVQSIAPYTDGNLPQRDQFRQVQCQDLSTNGIAFFADAPPAYDRLVVALASPFDVIYLTAAVAHCKEIAVEGQPPSYLIGCQFLGRIQINN